MTNEQTEIEGNDDTPPGSMPEERTNLFRELLEELDETPTELALRLRRLGDYRSKAAIMRSIQRMSAGDTAVSGEMLVIAKMLVNQQRLLEYKQAQVDWKRQHDDVWAATIDGFKVRLYRQTTGKWKVDLVFIETDYSPPWQTFPRSLEAAKRKALTCVADGLLDVAELKAGRL
ncbi:hypothetical protein Herbaro_06000 [Herbaspirillum sp. WKF16]|uniref:hypothetical protein n=1 Tax=Herbaspirillum sp. WKF16 TaxID=3028312 RepID=UPI0023A93584|nr:hypothetical protein [Herbaspirillum sp. WKF16]WDZ97340.1 hypothetical protein Herbaro_06000 [Herbaspirillum sp. WKF16]